MSLLLLTKIFFVSASIYYLGCIISAVINFLDILSAKRYFHKKHKGENENGRKE